MLFLDVKKACNNVGIDNPRFWLAKNGFSYVEAGRLINKRTVSINYAKLEKLCLLLNCTPNELISWQPKDTTTATNHPLNKLKQVHKQDSITGRLKTLPPEKLEEVKQFLEKLSSTV